MLFMDFVILICYNLHFYEYTQHHFMSYSLRHEFPQNRLALVHDFLIQMGGAEKVVEVMANQFPEAPIYTSVTKGQHLFPAFRDENRIRNTWMQKLPGIEKWHKMFFFLYPFAFRSLRTESERDVVWISSSGFSKWIPKNDGITMVCYCHTPPRFFWMPDEYLQNEISSSLLRSFVRKLMPFFRKSDKAQTGKIDLFVANSKNIRDRIKKCYGRDSIVIYPPVDVNRFQVSDQTEDFFLVVSRLVSYKKIDLAVAACTATNRKLVVIGDGPDRDRLEKMAGSTVTFLGRAPDAVVEEKMANCRGFFFPGLEDFGITPVEAQACGKPIIAYRGGGSLETVVENETGVFFDEFDSESVVAALEKFDTIDWQRQRIRENAERFSEANYIAETNRLLTLVGEVSDPGQIEQQVISRFEETA